MSADQVRQQPDIQAVKAVAAFLSSKMTKNAALVSEGFGEGMVIVAVNAHEPMYSVNEKLNQTGADTILLGIWFPERSAATEIPEYRQVQLIVCHATEHHVDNSDKYQIFDSLSPDAQVGALSDYLWHVPDGKINIPRHLNNSVSQKKPVSLVRS